jgi:dienelactone hydrolase
MIISSTMAIIEMTLISITSVADNQQLNGTQQLTMQGDLAEQMVAGIDKFFMRQIDEVKSQRETHWKRDFSSKENYVKSVEPNRQRLTKIIGAVDPREKPVMQLLATTSQPEFIGESEQFDVFAVRWNVLKGVDAEGLLLEPKEEFTANVIALPDCDWTPEMLVGLTEGVPESAQFARKLAESGCRVLVPMLLDRSDTFSGIPEIRLMNQPHREFIYRASYELGRNIIGYEVQKVLAGVDWFVSGEDDDLPIGVMGYGEGGLVAFYSSAIDTRIDVTCVSGYFQPRENIWYEPIYRNVWSLLYEFGDAEIASLIAPRRLIIEHCKHPEISGPPQPSQSHGGGAAPGVITTPSFDSVKTEFDRAYELIKPLDPDFTLVRSKDDSPGRDSTLKEFMESFGGELELDLSELECYFPEKFDPTERLKRQYQQLLDHTQYLMRESEFRRVEFWSKADASSVDTWSQTSEWYRDYLQNEVIGYSPLPNVPINPRTRCIYETDSFRGYEVVLDVYPEVFAYGILLVPKDVKDNERRPVVVCQHGLEGRPQDVANPSVSNESYHQFACKLAERGFITYAPQNPYIGMDNFRVLIRKSHPIKQSLYSIIVRQHERTLEWLSSLPFVDKERIGFYGLSYGGKTAMRIPAIVKGYCLSICSADYNEWIWKNVSARHGYSYMVTGEYDMFEFDLGNTFNYAELSWLICPRPFMVERGHHDGVAPDEWVAYEYAKTRRRYDLLGIGNLTEMEVFNGPHTINGVGTYEFLHRHLNWKKK